jgi:BspA type Leucine rich repeat region (6 copies)
MMMRVKLLASVLTFGGSRKYLLPLLLLLTLPAVVQAQSYKNNYGIWTYTTANGAITITGYTGLGGDVTIPDTMHGLPVVSIGNYPFHHCTSLMNFAIGGSVTNIGYRAFYSCASLADVALPNSVAEINGAAFGGCTSVTNVTIPDSVTFIGAAVFQACTGLTGCGRRLARPTGEGRIRERQISLWAKNGKNHSTSRKFERTSPIPTSHSK